MDCWEVLEIARFSDKKTIKIAYAKQLKLHRPDDDPQAFQRVHRAYQSALSWVPDAIEDTSAWMRVEDEPSDEALTEIVVESLNRQRDDIAVNTDKRSDETVTVDAPVLTELSNLDDVIAAEMSSEPELSQADRQLLDEIHAQEHLLSEDWQNLYSKTSYIVKSPTTCNDLNEWKSLESLVSMNDLEFRKAASDQVFEVVAEVNSASLANKHLYIKRPVLNYLNKLFSWDKKWQEYQHNHSREKLNAIYPYLEEAEKPVKGINKKRELYYYRRGAAFAIDLSLLFVPILVYLIVKSILVAAGLENWFESLGIKGESVAVIWVIAYLLLLIPFQESSQYQATIGKRLLELQVIDGRGDRIGFFQAFWRSLVTVGCCIGIKAVVFINFALSYWRSEILQDTLSRSYVILRPGYFQK